MTIDHFMIGKRLLSSYLGKGGEADEGQVHRPSDLLT